MYAIGLTGGIGSGKTTVANCFAALSVPIIDTDVIAHSLVQKNKPALQHIIDTLGARFLLPDGNLNRKALAEHIFTHPDDKQWLENYLHPLIWQEVEQRRAISTDIYCIIVVPLLIETGLYRQTDSTLVVDCPESLQIERALKREPMTPETLRAIMQAQATREERLAQADYVIYNDKGLDYVDLQVHSLHQEFLLLTRQKTRDSSL